MQDKNLKWYIHEAGYSIDGEMIYKSSVKSESHTFFSPSEIPSSLEEARKKMPSCNDA